MTALGWLLIGLMFIVAGIALAFAWFCASELARVQRLHGRHVSSRETAEARYSRLLAEDATAPRTTLLGPAETAGHADAMREAAGPFLPPSPAGEHPYPPYVPAWLPAVRKQTEDHAPWTGSQPVLDDETEAEMDRVRYIRSQLDECGDGATADDLQRVLDNLRKLPVYGEAPQDTVDEARRVAEVMQP